MSKSKTTPETVASTLSSLAADITSPSLTKTERRTMQSRNAIVPDELVEMISHLAEQGNGSVLGIPFDATTARATLTQTSSTRTALSVGRQTLQRMEDDMLQQRATVADPSFAIYTALRRLVKTKTGNSLAPAYAQMQSIVKNRPRKKRTKKTGQTGQTGQETSAIATAATTTPVAAPAAAAPAPSQPSPQAEALKAVASTGN